MLEIRKRTQFLWFAVLFLVTSGMAGAQQPAGSQIVVGTWTLVSETVSRGDQTVEPLGSDPLGSMILDRTGHFVMIISRRGLPNFAAKRRDAGTPDENKEVLAGLLAFFGKYTVGEQDNVLSIRVEASTFPNWIGTDQKRYFTLSGDEMIWTNRAPAVSGETAKLVWKRTE